MAKFQKGQGGRPKGAKNIKTRAKETRAETATKIMDAVVAATANAIIPEPIVPANKAADKTAKRAPRDDSVAALEQIQRDRWDEFEERKRNAKRMALALEVLRLTHVSLVPDSSIEDEKKRADEFKERKAVSGEAVKAATDALAEERRLARQAQNESGQWAKDRAPYEYAKLQPQSGNTDKTVIVNILKF